MFFAATGMNFLFQTTEHWNDREASGYEHRCLGCLPTHTKKRPSSAPIFKADSERGGRPPDSTRVGEQCEPIGSRLPYRRNNCSRGPCFFRTYSWARSLPGHRVNFRPGQRAVEDGKIREARGEKFVAGQMRITAQRAVLRLRRREFRCGARADRLAIHE